MSTFKLPNLLTNVAGLPSDTLVSGTSTTAALHVHVEGLCANHPELTPHLLYENGNIKEHFLFTANGELLDSQSALEPGSDIEILLAASGGVDREPMCSDALSNEPPGNEPFSNEPLSNDEVQRYVRHITLPEVGRAGQVKLKHAKVLVVGTGGLGSPVSLYLAAAGVGTLGLIDCDVVEQSNLQRQVVHGTSTVGTKKVLSAKKRLADINPHILIRTHDEWLNDNNAAMLFEQYDVVVDGTDNFATRYVSNDASVLTKTPLVFGSVSRFNGEVSVFNHEAGPCYQCLYPCSPPAELAPSCSAGGVLGIVPGTVGLIQATEAVKLILNIGKPLSGRLLRFNALDMGFSEIIFGRRKNCDTCGEERQPVKFDRLNASASGTQRLPDESYIEPQDLYAKLHHGIEDIVLLDVRESNELEVCRLPDTVHVPLATLPKNLTQLDASRAHCVVCYGGVRAEKASRIMMDAGFNDVRVLKDGMKGWVRDVEPGMPIY